MIEDTIYGSIYGDIIQLSKYLSNLRTMISPNISKITNEFDIVEEEELHEAKRMFSMGMLNGHFCVNARTCQAHTECDASYTIITIPPQTFDGHRILNPNFHFVINERFSILLPMVPNVSFLYSGFMLCHHQVLDTTDTKKGIFINLATYGNKRLFDNMVRSFRRSF